MAIQAQMYPENLVLPLMGVNTHSSSQDWSFMANNNFNNNFQQQKQQFEFQFQQQQQEDEVLLQLQEQYLLQLQNQQQRNSSCENNNNGGFVFLSSSKNNCTSTTTVSTTTTIKGSDYQIPMNFSSSFDDQIEKQRLEMDSLIALENERLKLALQEQMKQQLSTLMMKLEAKALQLLSQKDDEIARATKRTIELQDIITKIEIENQEWQRLASQNEAIVVSLTNKLEQLKENPCCTSSSSSSNDVEDLESRVEIESRVVLCKVCKIREVCILLLPCRHLCCCKRCEQFVDDCPVCKCSKMASVEALVS